MEPIEVLTPIAACVLFGRSGEAVRRAVREGHVRTPFSLAFTAKEVRLIDLQSAAAYWSTERGIGLAPWETEIAEMRRYGTVIQVHETEYAILHPYPLIATGTKVGALPDMELT